MTSQKGRASGILASGMFQAMIGSLEHDRQPWSVDLQLGKSLLEVRDEVMGERADCSNTHI